MLGVKLWSTFRSSFMLLAPRLPHVPPVRHVDGVPGRFLLAGRCRKVGLDCTHR